MEKLARGVGQMVDDVEKGKAEGAFADTVLTINQGVFNQPSTNQFLVERVIPCGQIKDNAVFESLEIFNFKAFQHNLFLVFGDMIA